MPIWDEIWDKVQGISTWYNKFINEFADARKNLFAVKDTIENKVQSEATEVRNKIQAGTTEVINKFQLEAAAIKNRTQSDASATRDKIQNEVADVKGKVEALKSRIEALPVELFSKVSALLADQNDCCENDCGCAHSDAAKLFDLEECVFLAYLSMNTYKKSTLSNSGNYVFNITANKFPCGPDGKLLPNPQIRERIIKLKVEEDIKSFSKIIIPLPGKQRFPIVETQLAILRETKDLGNGKTWKRLIVIYEGSKTAKLFDDPAIVADTAADWIGNFYAISLPYPYLPDKNFNVHRGFFLAYDATRKQLQTVIKKHIDNNDIDEFVFTGHSLGAALTTLAALDTLTTFHLIPKVKCYSFAGPRVFSKGLACLYDKLLPDSFRIVNAGDLAPKVPPPFEPPLDYRHVKNLVHLFPNGKIEVAPWFENSNYIQQFVGPSYSPATVEIENIHGLEQTLCTIFKTNTSYFLP